MLLVLPDIDRRLPPIRGRDQQLRDRRAVLAALAAEHGFGTREGLGFLPRIGAFTARIGAFTATSVAPARFGPFRVVSGKARAVHEAALEAAARPEPALDWALEDTQVRRIGKDAGAIVAGFLDSSMPSSRRSGHGIVDYRAFPTEGRQATLWHSCGTTFRYNHSKFGAAPGARVVLAAVLTVGDAHEPCGDSEAVFQGLEWLLGWEGPRGDRIGLINASIDMDEEDSSAFASALANAHAAGRSPILVAASGNAGSAETAKVAVPASIPEVLAVGGLHKPGDVWEYSGWRPATGSTVAKPDLIAPATSIWTIDEQGRPGACIGTSLASPIVTGALARLLAAGYRGRDAVDQLLAHHVKALPDPRAGAGTLRFQP